MLTRKLTGLTIGASLLLGLAAPAQASFLTSILTANVQNDFEDQSREAFYDNGDGVFGVGDILTGFVKVDNKSAPNAVPINNEIYAVFSQEIVSVAGTTVTFGAVTSDAGLSLSGLGVSGALATDVIAFYSKTGGYATDLINASPGDLTGNGTVTLADYLDMIINETGSILDMRFGLTDTPLCSGVSPSDSDCFQGTSQFIGAATSNFINAPSNVTIANFIGALSSSLDPAGFVLADGVVAGAFTAPAPLLAIAEGAVSNGAARGTAGSAFASEWTDGSELSSRAQCQATQGGPSVICGFIDDADYGILPTRVPEPTSIALLGIGLLGMGAARRKRRS